MATAPITEPGAAGGRLAVIVVNYRTPALALACLDAVAADRASLAAAGHVLDLVMVDGGSGDDSTERLADGIAARRCGDWVTLLPLGLNGGFGYANNQALLRLAGRPDPPAFVCLLNPDARPLPGALATLVAALATRPRAAAVGAQLQGDDGTPQGSAFTFPSLGGELSRGANTDIVRRLSGTPPIVVAAEGPCRAPWVTGAAVLFRWSALAEVGLFDDGFFLYFEEVDLMRRLGAAGWEIWHEPAARVEHVGGGATDVRWDESGFHKAAPLPTYWYRSRRRYLVRAGGAAYAIAATLLFVAGRLLWLARVRLGGKTDRFPARTSRDMLRHSLWPTRADRFKAPPPRLGDARDATPRWMRDAGPA